MDGETGERNSKRNAAKKAWRSESSASDATVPVAIVKANYVSSSIQPHAINLPQSQDPPLNSSSTASNDKSKSLFDKDQKKPNIDNGEICSGLDESGIYLNDTDHLASDLETARDSTFYNDSENTVDIRVMEEELVRIAPTIADLFQKFANSSSKQPVSEEEIRNVKQENQRLRKTNRALIDKLNTFQHRIIGLQCENKKLREEGDGVVETKEELDRKETELKELERRLEEQKNALEAKEIELNDQLMKIKDIEEDISIQQEQIEQLQNMREDDQVENERQQEELLQLRDDKKKQQQQILKLEFKQRIGEERLQSLDSRLKQLENPKRMNPRKSDPKYKSRRPLGMFYS